MSEKSVLISVRPKWCELIANGQKTIEVRKTLPKLETPFKCYIYCTLKPDDANNLLEIHGEDGKIRRANGKVIGEFVCDKVFYIAYTVFPHAPLVFEEMGTTNRPDVIKETCLTEIEIDDYLNDENGYGWHISNLQIYDKPRELGEFHKPIMPTGLRYEDDVIKRPPQSWCYAEEGGKYAN